MQSDRHKSGNFSARQSSVDSPNSSRYSSGELDPEDANTKYVNAHDWTTDVDALSMQVCLDLEESIDTDSTTNEHTASNLSATAADDVDILLKEATVNVEDAEACSIGRINDAVSGGESADAGYRIRSVEVAESVNEDGIEMVDMRSQPDVGTASTDIDKKAEVITWSVDIKLPSLDLTLRWRHLGTSAIDPEQQRETLVSLTTVRTKGTTSLLLARVDRDMFLQMTIASCELVHANQSTTILDAETADVPAQAGNLGEYDQTAVVEAVGESSVSMFFRLSEHSSGDDEVSKHGAASGGRPCGFKFDRYRNVDLIDTLNPDADFESDFESVESCATTSSDSSLSSRDATNSVASAPYMPSTASVGSAPYSSAPASPRLEPVKSADQPPPTPLPSETKRPRRPLERCCLHTKKKYMFHCDVLTDRQRSRRSNSKADTELTLFCVNVLRLTPRSCCCEESPDRCGIHSGNREQLSLSFEEQYEKFNDFVNTHEVNGGVFNLTLDVNFASLKTNISETFVDNLGNLEIFLEDELSIDDSFSQLLMWYVPIFDRDQGDAAADNVSRIPALRVKLTLPQVSAMYFSPQAARAHLKCNLQDLCFTTTKNDASTISNVRSDSRFMVGEAILDIFGYAMDSSSSADTQFSCRVFSCTLQNFRAKQVIASSTRKGSSSEGSTGDGDEVPTDASQLRTRLCGSLDDLQFSAGDVSSPAKGCNGTGDNADDEEPSWFSATPKAAMGSASAFNTNPYTDNDVAAIIVLRNIVDHISSVRNTFSRLNQSRLFVRILKNEDSNPSTLCVLPRTEVIALFVQTVLEYEQSLRSRNVINNASLPTLLMKERHAYHRRQKGSQSVEESKQTEQRTAGRKRTWSISPRTFVDVNVDSKVSHAAGNNSSSLSSLPMLHSVREDGEDDEGHPVKVSEASPSSSNETILPVMSVFGDGDDAFALSEQNDVMLSGWPLMVHLGRLVLLSRVREDGALAHQWAKALRNSRSKLWCKKNLLDGGAKLEPEQPATLADRLGAGTHSIHKDVAQWVWAFDNVFSVMYLDEVGRRGGHAIGQRKVSASKFPDLFSFTVHHVSGKFWIQQELQKIFLFEAYDVRFLSTHYCHKKFSSDGRVKGSFRSRARTDYKDSQLLNAHVSSFMCTLVPSAVTRVEKILHTDASAKSSTPRGSPFLKRPSNSAGQRSVDQYTAIKSAVDTFSVSMQRLIAAVQDLIPGRVSSHGLSIATINPTVLLVCDSLRFYMQANTFIGFGAEKTLSHEGDTGDLFNSRRKEICAVVEADRLNLSFNTFPRLKPKDGPVGRPSNCVVGHISTFNVHFNGFRKDIDDDSYRDEGSHEISLRLLLKDLVMHATNASNLYETHERATKARSASGEPDIAPRRFESVARRAMAQSNTVATSNRRDRVTFGVTLGSSSLDVATHLLDFSQVSDFAVAWLNVLDLPRRGNGREDTAHDEGDHPKPKRESNRGVPIRKENSGDRRKQSLISPSTSSTVQSLLFLDIHDCHADISLSPQLRVTYYLSSLFTSVARQPTDRQFGFKLRIGTHHICFGRNQSVYNRAEVHSNLQNLAQIWIDVHERAGSPSSIETKQVRSVNWTVLVGAMKNRFHFKHLHQVLVLSETLNNEFLLGVVKHPALFAQKLSKSRKSKRTSNHNTASSFPSRTARGQGVEKHCISLCLQDFEVALVSAWRGGLVETCGILEIKTLRCRVERHSRKMQLTNRVTRSDSWLHTRSQGLPEQPPAPLISPQRRHSKYVWSGEFFAFRIVYRTVLVLL